MKRIFLLMLALVVLCTAMISCEPKNGKDDGKDTSAETSASQPSNNGDDFKVPYSPAPDEPFNGEDDEI